MDFEAQRNSNNSPTPSGTESDYSQLTGNERDEDYDDPNIEDTQYSHVTTPDKHPEASEITPEKAQSSRGCVADTEKSFSEKLAEIKEKVTGLDLEILSDIERNRDHFHTRKEYYKALASDLEKDNEELVEDNEALIRQFRGPQKGTATLKAENDKLKAENDKLKAEKDKLRAEKDSLEAEKDKLKAGKDNLEAERDKMIEDVKKLIPST